MAPSVDGAAAVRRRRPSGPAAVAGDLSSDGLLDSLRGRLHRLRQEDPQTQRRLPQDYYGIPDRLYVNEGRMRPDAPRFREVTAEAGLLREERALGALLSDLDGDGDLDLYIANDGHPNRLYLNEPDAQAPSGFHLVDWTTQADVGDSGSGMGVTGGDYDGDGLLDLFITNWERELNALYRNLSGEADELTFQYSTFRIGISGLGNGMTGWGTHLADFDHDTDTDLLIVNGRVPVTNLETDPELVRFYRNRTVEPGKPEGRPGHFFDWTGQVGLKELGPLLGAGQWPITTTTAIWTWPSTRIAGDLVLLTNDAAAHWLILDPGAVVPGLRTVVTLPDGRTLVREAHAGSSYLASEDFRLHFGLGVTTVVPQIELFWPDGRREVLAEVGADQIYSLR
ncbi:MAG: CRTAC1 family protein [Caldilineaceae bacterium]